MKSFLFILFFCLIYRVPNAWAGLCTVQIQRICQAAKVCRSSETLTALKASSEECLHYAKSLCPIRFSDGIASKQVRVVFDGKSALEGQNICSP